MIECKFNNISYEECYDAMWRIGSIIKDVKKPDIVEAEEKEIEIIGYNHSSESEEYFIQERCLLVFRYAMNAVELVPSIYDKIKIMQIVVDILNQICVISEEAFKDINFVFSVYRYNKTTVSELYSYIVNIKNELIVTRANICSNNENANSPVKDILLEVCNVLVYMLQCYNK